MTALRRIPFATVRFSKSLISLANCLAWSSRSSLLNERRDDEPGLPRSLRLEPAHTSLFAQFLEGNTSLMKGALHGGTHIFICSDLDFGDLRRHGWPLTLGSYRWLSAWYAAGVTT
jgi:hypothetical protein